MKKSDTFTRLAVRVMLILAAAGVIIPALPADIIKSQNYTLNIMPVAEDIDYAWGFDFLPDGQILLTQKNGRMFRIDTKTGSKTDIREVPFVAYRSQGGLLDVLVHPDFARNRVIFITYSEPVTEDSAQTAVMRAVLDRDRLTEKKCKTDGRALPEIYSYGHRNPQGMTVHPQTGEIWSAEHGAMGGDEINIIRAGVNYGWPVISYGLNYNGTKIGEGTEKTGIAQPLYYWDPSVAPSGMTFYSGRLFPEWKGNLLAGSLKFGLIIRLITDNGKISGEERLSLSQYGRIRDVKEAPDGSVMFITDQPDSALYRITPAKEKN
ncbi:hypothetical protein CHS0354_018392 [Potamilus streckersoni]|uniref:Glucose/Sorbosone dehydrogenase domain-containing protein n=1 Tax=Potamilus streckersoni TaxID=2493646 RepID=A0AAE0TB71_9BIVA|nr:hypothetical protein CHS0354_018392 [Potamilus streckersoni]